MRIEESQGSTGPQNGHAQPAKAAPTAEQVLGEIRDYCRATRTAESTFGRLVVNDGKLVSRLRDGARITTGTLDKVRAYLSEHASAPAAARQTRSGGQGRATARLPRPTWRRRLPVFRQPAEIPAVRLDLQRKDRDRQPDFARTRQSAAGAAGAAHLRRRRRRRHRVVAGDAGAARPVSDHAALRRRQGNQLRGRPPDAGKDGGPPVRTSGDRAGDHQSVLRGGAVADAALGDGGARPDLEGCRAVRQHRARLRRADRRTRRVPGRELARRDQSDQRQSGLYEAHRADAAARGSLVPARSDHATPGAGDGGLRPGHRLAALSGPGERRIQGLEGGGAAGAVAAVGRPVDRHPFARRRSRME